MKALRTWIHFSVSLISVGPIGECPRYLRRCSWSTSRLVDAPASWWIDLAKVMLGANQPMPWSMTVIMKVDFVGPGRRSLALGVNELQHRLFSRRLPAGM